MEMDSEDLLSGDQEGGDQDVTGLDVDQLLGEEDHTMEEGRGEDALAENVSQVSTEKSAENNVEQDQTEVDTDNAQTEQCMEEENQGPYFRDHHHVCSYPYNSLYYTVVFKAWQMAVSLKSSKIFSFCISNLVFFFRIFEAEVTSEVGVVTSEEGFSPE